MPKSYFLMKAEKASQALLPKNALWSIKYDGIRAFWDGGITKGRTDVPWSTDPKYASTGLWTNNGKVIVAPDYWLAGLPPVPCDGELWAGPGGYNYVSSVCRTKNQSKDHMWQRIRFMHHTDITWDDFLSLRLIDEKHCNLLFLPSFKDYVGALISKKTFFHRANDFYALTEWHPVESWEDLNERILPELANLGHEGLMIKDLNLVWTPVRSKQLLKLKPWHDAEGYVVGVTAGKDGHLGRAGGLVVKWNGVTFGLGNLLLSERDLISIDTSVSAVDVARDMPGELLPGSIQCAAYPNGIKVTFKYKEKTPNGVPREPKLWRIREDLL